MAMDREAGEIPGDWPRMSKADDLGDLFFHDLTGPNSPQRVVSVGNSPPFSPYFRWVKYDNSPRMMG